MRLLRRRGKGDELIFYDRLYSVEEIIEEYELFYRKQGDDIKMKMIKEQEQKDKKQ